MATSASMTRARAETPWTVLFPTESTEYVEGSEGTTDDSMTGFDKANDDDNDDDLDDEDEDEDEDEDGLDAAKMVAIRAASEAFRSMRSNTRCRVCGSRLDRRLCVIHPPNAHRLQIVVLVQRRNALLRGAAKNPRGTLRQVRFLHVGIWLAEEQS